MDLIDYWNLRVAGRWVIPMPIQLADHSLNDISSFVKKNYIPDKHNKDWMLHTTIICSRSCKPEQVEAYIKKLTIPPKSLMRQDWYPRVWNEWARIEAEADIGILTVMEDSVTVVSSGGRISFDTLKPNFVDYVPSNQSPSWINVINLSQQGELNSAPVIPPGINDLDRILCAGSIYPSWATTEGLVVPCFSWRDSQFWELPIPISLFQAYMGQFGFQVDISPAGKITLQMLRAIGGIWGIFSFGNEEVLKKLEEMALGVAESDSDSPEQQCSRKARARTVSHKTWWSLLQRINDGNPKIAKNHLKNLLEYGVFKRGIHLQCPTCSQHTWFGLDQLSEEVICERCLESFPFPMTPPHESSWHYRTVGPFSIEGYAHGSYCTLLTANFLFGHHIRGEAKWMPSITLKNTKKSGDKSEVDFVAFWRLADYQQSRRPILVMGECKTFDLFKNKDIERMTALADAFPGAMIVFSTLRKTLEEEEKRLITSLADKGRSTIKDDQWRNPVMVLMGVELLNRMGPPHCWTDAGEPYAKFERQYWQYRKPQDLCELLQRMHLGMEPYHVWYEKNRLAAQVDKQKDIVGHSDSAIQKV